MKIYFLFLLLFNLFKLYAFEIKPIDETNKDTSLMNFRNNLLKAIELKDTLFLFSVLDSNIQTNFDGMNNLEEFKGIWELENGNTELWKILNQVILLGGAFSKNHNDKFQFVYPYINELELEADDYFEVFVVLNKNIDLKSSKDLNSKTILTLNNYLVRIDLEKNGYNQNDWLYVQTYDKKHFGYLYKPILYSPIDYRLWLSKKSGEWKITCLIAGD